MRIKKVEMNMANMNQPGKVSCGEGEKNERKTNKQSTVYRLTVYSMLSVVVLALKTKDRIVAVITISNIDQ